MPDDPNRGGGAPDPDTGSGAPDPGAGGTPGAPDPGAGDGKPGATWYDALPLELRDDTSLLGFKDGGVDALAKGYANLHRTLGKDKIVIPGDDASQEEWDAVYGKLGRPEKPDGYDFKGIEVPEGLPWNQEFDTAMMGIAHQEGLSNKQLRALRAGYIEHRNKEHTGLLDGIAEDLQTVQTNLKKDWGNDYDRKLDLAKRVAAVAFGDDLPLASNLMLADKTQLLTNPLIAKAFATIGEKIAEPGALDGVGASGFGPMTPDAAQAEINRIMAEARTGGDTHPYNDARHPENKALHKKVLDLHGVIHQGTVGG